MKAAILVTATLLLQWGCAPAPTRTTTATPAHARKPAVKPVMLCGANLLISYKGAPRAIPGVSRTHREARDLVLSLAARARQDPAIFAELARKHSDGPGASRGGHLGVWTAGRMPIFDRTFLELEGGAVSVPLASPFGFHILKRLPLPKLYAASHILISFAGVERLEATRTKEEARGLAGKLAQQAAKDPATFARLAREHSDCPSAKMGGVLGIFPRGRMVPAFEAVLRALKVGQISGIVETQFGFHLIRRDPAPKGTMTR